MSPALKEDSAFFRPLSPPHALFLLSEDPTHRLLCAYHHLLCCAGGPRSFRRGPGAEQEPSQGLPGGSRALAPSATSGLSSGTLQRSQEVQLEDCCSVPTVRARVTAQGSSLFWCIACTRTCTPSSTPESLEPPLPLGQGCPGPPVVTAPRRQRSETTDATDGKHVD